MRINRDDAKSDIESALGQKIGFVKAAAVRRRIGKRRALLHRELGRTTDNFFTVELIGSQSHVNEAVFTSYLGETAVIERNLRGIFDSIRVWSDYQAEWLAEQVVSDRAQGAAGGASYEKMVVDGLPLLFVRVQ